MSNVRKKKSAYTIKQESEIAAYSRALATVVRCAIKGTTLTELAQKTAYTKQALCMLLNQPHGEEKRHWTFTALLSISKALGMSLSEFIAEAEQVMKGDHSMLRFRLQGTAPRSPQRLMEIIRAACDQRTDVAVAFDLHFYEDYYGGKLTDREAYLAIRDKFKKGE